ncbi:MAG: SDR family oxidoreductase [Anaerovibrio sp.]|uniref:SDR family NAD(P)-dependent oxidoreductase n=1 Tax=Anaerovibrio sp. TaxID=1872532 RepID=UPI0025BDEC65|nr:SDR family NAD(P)-dependent oxidoreductase [Anaerovibrio sp.]MBE6099352.1 SDR family oxidoreductase [Anaerovibrio sp.]
MLLKGKNAVITGCSRGIGKAILTAFAQNGANVFACVRNLTETLAQEFESLANEYSVEIRPVVFDICDEAGVKKAVTDIRKAHCSIDVLVNNAGALSENTLFQMTPIDNMRNLFEVNFFSQMRLVQYVSRLMQRNEHGGSIVQIASMSGLDGAPGQLEYVSSKAAMVGATKTLAREFGSNAIRVNAIAPGIIETEMGKAMDEVLAKDFIDHSALARWGKPEEVANTAVFLASDMSSYITGQVIRVDGGIKIGNRKFG